LRRFLLAALLLVPDVARADEGLCGGMDGIGCLALVAMISVVIPANVGPEAGSAGPGFVVGWLVQIPTRWDTRHPRVTFPLEPQLSFRPGGVDFRFRLGVRVITQPWTHFGLFAGAGSTFASIASQLEPSGSAEVGLRYYVKPDDLVHGNLTIRGDAWEDAWRVGVLLGWSFF
jgi:hypothetical protein